MRKFSITDPARKDIKEALIQSRQRHGKFVQKSYENLILIALKNLESIENPLEPIGSNQFKDTIYRQYHLRMAKKESAKMGHRIKQPSHTFFYEVREDEVIVHALIPDMRDFIQHLIWLYMNILTRIESVYIC